MVCTSFFFFFLCTRDDTINTKLNNNPFGTEREKKNDDEIGAENERDGERERVLLFMYLFIYLIIMAHEKKKQPLNK